MTAVAGLSAASAFAQSGVAMYGRVELGLRYESANNLPPTQMDSGTYSAIGFKGQEDQGSGLKAFFQMEHRIDATGATKTLIPSSTTSLWLVCRATLVPCAWAVRTTLLTWQPTDAFGGD